MSTIVTLNPEHGYVAAVVAMNTVLEDLWMAMMVSRARKEYGVHYPTMYADEGKVKEWKKFNCTQRAHQNSIEKSSYFYASLLVGGVKYPLASAIGGAIYSLGRLIYFRTYSKGEPSRRHTGTLITHIGSVVMLSAVLKSAWDLLSPQFL